MLPTRRQRQARMELALVFGGTLGVASVMLLRMAKKHDAANALAFLGVLAGGILGTLRVVERFPEA